MPPKRRRKNNSTSAAPYIPPMMLEVITYDENTRSLVTRLEIVEGSSSNLPATTGAAPQAPVLATGTEDHIVDDSGEQGCIINLAPQPYANLLVSPENYLEVLGTEDGMQLACLIPSYVDTEARSSLAQPFKLLSFELLPIDQNQFVLMSSCTCDPQTFNKHAMLVEHCRQGTISNIRTALNGDDFQPCNCAKTFAEARRLGPLHLPVPSAAGFKNAAQAASQRLRGTTGEDGTTMVKGKLCGESLLVVRPGQDGIWGWIGRGKRNGKLKCLKCARAHCAHIELIEVGNE